METKKKGIFIFALGGTVLQMLSGCTGSATTNDQNLTTQSTATSSDAAVEVIKNDKLAINAQKCIGCGKCARTASNNFVMNSSTHKAEVISQEIASQTVITRSVDGCPTHAITQ
jgi:ferredoxin